MCPPVITHRLNIVTEFFCIILDQRQYRRVVASDIPFCLESEPFEKSSFVAAIEFIEILWIIQHFHKPERCKFQYLSGLLLHFPIKYNEVTVLTLCSRDSDGQSRQ